MGTDPESILFTSEPSGKISYPLAYLFHKEKEREREREREKNLRLWSGSTDSKTHEYQIVITHTKEIT